MQCPVCKSEVSNGMKFCSRCGSPLPKMKFCANCGEEITTDVKFCRKCGAPNALYIEPVVSNVNASISEGSKQEVSTDALVNNRQSITSVSDPLDQYENSCAEDIIPEYYEQPEKSNKALILTVVICLIAIIGMCAVYYVMTKDDSKVESKETSVKTDGDSTPRRFENEENIEISDNKSTGGSSINTTFRNQVDSNYSTPHEKTISTPLNSLGFRSGKNSFNAAMIHTDGRRFPFDLSLNYNPNGSPEITNAVYYNPSAGAKVKLKVDVYNDGFIRLSGTTGGKPFILEFSGSNPYTGDAWWGDFHQDVEMSLN